ncbi:hypothetical protein ACFFGR_18435 [Arthrobacter liuii]|uniref:Uncharacterized protein n=1 Tax=Arthrobacter liuii TaxID=1476996 RepID=A0ABQ2B0E0_9MICC|nr:hypothetical protein [Arthrobacter liuii]GGI01114.1 hypothetical protein GCM10007170_39810 [Arthrobacter liuii]
MPRVRIRKASVGAVGAGAVRRAERSLEQSIRESRLDYLNHANSLRSIGSEWLAVMTGQSEPTAALN